jgi:hypothetical protein
VSPGFFQAPGPLNVGRLIEARTQFDNSVTCFPALAASMSASTIGGITACAIERDS